MGLSVEVVGCRVLPGFAMKMRLSSRSAWTNLGLMLACKFHVFKDVKL